ncbi:MAG: Glutathione transport system permease protein GsiC [Pseudomonadota bacterium]|jgi:peptide/nickel transport system permease protein
MLKLIFHRLLLSIPLLFAVTFLTFFLNSLAPTDLARTLLGADGTQEQYLELRTKLGLDQPLLMQYGDWVWKVLHGDLGVSYFTNERVADLLNGRIGVTLSIMVGVLVVIVLVGVSLGVLSATRGGWLGKLLDAVSLLGLVFPSFFVALVYIVVFAVWLQWFPATGYTTLNQGFAPWAMSLVLPILAVSTYFTSVVAKQTREAMSDVMRRDFIRALRASGLSEWKVVLQHGLRNASLPVITTLGLLMVNAMASAVFVERAFVLPGLGSLAVGAADQADVQLMLGCTLYFALLSVAINLLVDLSYGWLNPKVRA